MNDNIRYNIRDAAHNLLAAINELNTALEYAYSKNDRIFRDKVVPINQELAKNLYKLYEVDCKEKQGSKK